jgi:hypothetical protein
MTDSTGPNPFEQVVRSFQAAMAAESIPAETIEHVVNRVLYGDPHPGRRHRIADEVSIHVQFGPPIAAHQQAVRAAVAGTRHQIVGR